MFLPNQLELQTLFSGFLFEAGLSSVSVKNYLSDLRNFLSFCASISDHDSPPTVQEIFQNLSKFLNQYLDEQKRNYTPQNTLNRRLASIRRFSVFMDSKFGLAPSNKESHISSKNTPTIVGSSESSGENARPGIEKILDQFRHFLEKEKKTHSTVKNYISDLNHFFEWSASSTPFMDQDFENLLSMSQLEAYVTYLRLSHTSTSVINRRQSSIKQFTRYCFLQKYIPINPFEYKHEAPRLAPLSWFDRLITPKNKAKKSGPRTRLAIWYQKYNSLPFTPYLHLAILALATSAMVIFGYNQIIKQAVPSSAALPTVPRRQLSFQGRLTDSSGTPIVAPVTVVFKLWNHLTAGSQLYTSGDCSITPDGNGIFNTLIGNGTCGPEIANTVFTENRDVYLEVAIGVETLTPRQQIATVGYALNSETLQGYPASATATINTIPVVDNNGDINIASSPFSINSSGTSFTLSGQTLNLITAPNSGGDIVIQPDDIGGGMVLIDVSGVTNTDALRIIDANLTTGNLISGYIGNNNYTGRLLSLTSGSSETDRFYVGASGQTMINTAATLANAALIANQYGTGDLFTASASGTAKFTIGNTGNIAATGTLTGLTGLTVASGTVSLPNLEINNAEISELDWTKLQNYPAACPAGEVVQQIGDTLTCVALPLQYWQRTEGSLAPLYITDSLNLGSTATSSALVHLAGTAAENSWINTGNFGIGTTNPTAKLDVEGSASISGTLAFRGTTDPKIDILNGEIFGIRLSPGGDVELTQAFTLTNTGINSTNIGATTPETGVFTDLSSTGSTTFGDAGGDTVTSNAGAWTFANATTVALNNIVNSLNIDSNTISVDALNNRVGIGTTTPLTALDIAGSASSSGTLSFTGSTDPKINILNGENFGIQTSVGGDAVFTERFTILNNGNVGIGLINPSYTLDINGSMHLSGALMDVNTQAGGTGQILSSTGTGVDWIDLPAASGNNSPWNWNTGVIYPFSITDAVNLGNAATASATVHLAGVVTDDSFVMGQFGIGLINPANALDVTGDVNITGALKDNGSAGNSGDVLSSTGTGIQWIAPSSVVGVNQGWTWNTGVLYPTSITDAINLGNAATASATVHLAGIATDTTLINTPLDINASKNYATNINTGTSTGAISIGGGSNTVAVDSTNWNVSTLGAATDFTGFNGLVVTANTGVITTGTWNASLIPLAYGGTNKNMPLTQGGVVWVDSDSMEVSAVGVAGQILSSNGTAAPTWINAPTGGNNSPWDWNTGVIYPFSITDAVNLGNAATASATVHLAGIATDTTLINTPLNINVSQNNATNINTGTSTGAITIGGGAVTQTITLNSSDWDVNTTGDMTGIGAITMDGLLTGTLGSTITGAAVNLNASSNFATNINTGTSTGAVAIGGNGGTVAIDSSDWNIDATGAMSDIGAIAMDGAITGSTGFNGLVVTANTGVITTGTWNASLIPLTYGGTNKNMTAVNGGVVWTDADSMEVSAAGAANQILTSNGAAAPSWIDRSALNFWQRNSGALTPLEITNALNLGAVATGSAIVSLPGTSGDDALFNLGSGNVGIGASSPNYMLTIDAVDGGNTNLLSISDIMGNQVAKITGDLTDSNDLAFSFGDTTGLFGFSGNQTTGYFSFIGGNVGIGTQTPSVALEIAGATSTIANASGNITFNSASGIFDFSGDSLSNFLNATASGQIHLGNFSDAALPTALGTGSIIYSTTQNSVLVWDGAAWSLLAGDTGTSYWQRSGGVLSPLDLNDAINLGNTATASAFVHLAGKTGDNSFINTGNFGIGLINPSEKLQVTGNAIISGNFLPNSDLSGNIGSGTKTWLAVYTAGINDASGTETISVSNRRLVNGNWNIESGLRIGDLDSPGAYKLWVQGNASVSGTFSTGGDASIANGVGKIDVGTVDPPYTINGSKYATYMASMVGIKEETIGKVTTTADGYVEGLGYRTLIDLDQQPIGSDVWLFSQTTDIQSHINDLSVLLTPEGQAKAWYEVDKPNKILAIYSSTPTSITYRLSAPRFDAYKWTNTRTSVSVGHVINDPNIYTNTGSIFDNPVISPELIAKEDGTYTLLTNGQENKEVSTFMSSIIANLQVGAAVVANLVTDNLTVKTKLVSPLADIDQINAINATISGTLYANDIKGQTIDTLHAQINLLDEKYSTASAILSDLQSRYGSYDSLLSGISTATVSGDPLALSPLATTSAVIPSDLALDSLNVHTLIANDLMANGSIFGNSFSSFNTDLFIQPTGDKPVHLLANLMTLYPDGKVLINGDIIMTGTLFSQGLDTQVATVSGSLAVGSSTIASESANFNKLTTSGLIIASGNDPQATISGQTNSNATIGIATIATGTAEISILNTKVTPTTLIYVTPTSNTEGRVLFVKSKTEGVGFTIATTGNVNNNSLPISFNYWLVETK